MKSYWSKYGFLVLLGFSSLVYFLFPASQFRGLSSESKPQKLEFKSTGIIDVSVTPVGGIPENNEQELTLKGTVTLHQILDGEIEYRWILPPEAQLVSGELEDSWADLPINKPVEVKITITGVSRESASSFVVFRAQNTVDGLPIGSSAIFTPKPESVHF